MNETNDFTSNRDFQQCSSDERVDKCLSVSSNTTVADEESRTVLSELEELPFRDDDQKSAFLENVQRLQGKHLVQSFKFGVAPLRASTTKSTQFLEEVIKVFELCFTFCYTTEVSKRIAFDFFARALQFCFPVNESQCLSAEILSKLLQLVQILQEGNLASIVCVNNLQVANLQMQINGAKYLFGELLTTFEKRRDKGNFAEIVEQTLRFASKDASVSCIEEQVIGLRSDHVVTPVFLSNWIKLLKFENVSNGFACTLAKMDDPRCTKQYLPLFYPFPHQIENNVYESEVCYFVNVLEEMKRRGNEVTLPSDEEKLRTFFDNIHHFSSGHSSLTMTSLKLLANNSISNEVLVQILGHFCCGEQSLQNEPDKSQKALGFELVCKALSVFSDGKLVKKLLNVWREMFPGSHNYEALWHFINLVLEGSKSENHCSSAETAEKILKFLHCLPKPLLPLVSLWCPFLVYCVKIFPTSFQSRQDVLVRFIRSTAQRGQEPLAEQRPIFNFLQWIAQQSCSEKKKEKMIMLLMSCLDKASMQRNREFSVNVIKQLSLCEPMRLIVKKNVIDEFIRLAKFFKERGKDLLQNVVESIASDQNLELKDEIFSEILYFVERCSGMRTIPTEIQQLLSLVSRCPISSERRVKLLQRSKKSGKGLLNGIQILQLVKNRHHVPEEANEYFDVLFFDVFDFLKEDEDKCGQFYNQLLSIRSLPVQDLWTFVVPGLISLDLFKGNIDTRWCLPVLQDALGLTSPLEMLALYSQLRKSAVKIVEQLRDQAQMHLSSRPPDSFYLLDCVEQGTFVSCLGTVVRSQILSCQEKLFLVKKVCDMLVESPKSLTGKTVQNALYHLIPFPWLPNNEVTTSNTGIMRLDLYQIESILKDPAVMAQLSRLPTDLNKSFCSIFSTRTSSYFSCGSLMDIYHFIGSQENLNDDFFNNVLEIIEVAAQVSCSVEEVIAVLKEIIGLIRAVPSELILFIMDNFRFLLEKHVIKEERERFINELAVTWDCLANSHVLSYLEVPQLLWKVCSSTNSPVRRRGLIDRIQKILHKTKHVERFCAQNNKVTLLDSGYLIRRRIASCELEWLVLHSSLSSDEATLAYELSISCWLNQQRLRCFTFADVQIEGGCFKFVSQETTLGTADRSREGISTATAVEGEEQKDSSVTDPHVSLLTPALIAEKMIHHIKRVLRQGEDLSEIAFSLWGLAFKEWQFSCELECAGSLTFYDNYLEVLLSILTEASSTEIMLHWAKEDSHFVCQCSEVVLKACKRSDDTGNKAMLNFQAVVSSTLETVRLKTPRLVGLALCPLPCFLFLKPQLKHLSDVLESRLPIEVTKQILGLFQTNVLAAGTVAEIVPSWSRKDQIMEVVKSVHRFCQEGEVSSALNASQSPFVWQLIKAFGRFCIDSSEDLMGRLKDLLLLQDPEDAYGFTRLPKWRELMIADDLSPHVIDCWCVAFLTTPPEGLSSRDVDAIVDLDPNSLKLVSALSREKITSCIFPENGFEVTQGKGIKEPLIKERLRLARLLGEFINMLKLRKPEENRKDAVVKQIVEDACYELCKAYENPNKRRKGADLYKIHREILKALFTEVFGKQRKSDTEVNSGGEASGTVDDEPRRQMCVTRQSSYLHENLPHILNNNEVFEPLLVLLRRWLSRSMVKETLASHTLGVVQLLFSIHSAVVGAELHSKIQAHVSSLEQNQILIAQLQASGYNQITQGSRDLWHSSSVECSGYITRRESPGGKRFLKKLTQSLRILWNEWKDILLMLGKAFVKVGETEVPAQELFGLQATLEEMEKQVSAVKETVNKLELGTHKRRVKQLMREEQRRRARIGELYKSTESSEAPQRAEPKKFVAVWENRFLENVKLCSERIPGCYAPNGFHSDKPVVCALSVDNRILTVFKEEKNGRREEIENVEVKLMEAGMYVFGLHSSEHDYVTDELWAAFFKMLLEERLVPNIVLSNESPGFEWITKFVRPEPSYPYPWKWELHQGIVPLEEDYFDYQPITAALWPALYGLTKFLTLTRENVANVQFEDFKDAFAVEEKEKVTKDMTGRAIRELKNELRLLHGDGGEMLAGKLAFAVRQTIKSLIDDEDPTEEIVKQFIDMERLAHNNPQVQSTNLEKSRQQYASAVIRTCKMVMGTKNLTS